MADETEALEPAETHALTVFDKELDILLLEDEEVLYAGRPQAAKLRLYLSLMWSFVAVLSVIGIPLLPFIWWMAGAYVKKHRYWLTSSRVVVTNGLVGYRARSIPLERVSDVAISCTWLERLVGIRSVRVRDMTGEAQGGAAMMAMLDAPKIQEKILSRVHQVNRRTPSAENERMRPAYREIGEEERQGQMLELLRRIEKNTRPGADED